MDAFRVRFETIVFAQDTLEAGERLKVWRALSTACGFQPGSGQVVKLADRDLDQNGIRGELERARNERDDIASERLRERAISSLATHMDGELDAARGIIEAIEASSKRRLPTSTASLFAGAFRTKASLA